ncbi:MAG: hypothetical protein Ct9H300mP16_19660 [Pseudomonadota bacterium]|nr:MAG: hypothetical protein Ct9H300mP16_19660 [Pseudomonadota bacterium]
MAILKKAETRLPGHSTDRNPASQIKLMAGTDRTFSRVSRSQGGPGQPDGHCALAFPQEERQPGPGQSGGRYQPLTETEVERIHQAALEALPRSELPTPFPCRELISGRRFCDRRRAPALSKILSRMPLPLLHATCSAGSGPADDMDSVVAEPTSVRRVRQSTLLTRSTDGTALHPQGSVRCSLYR